MWPSALETVSRVRARACDGGSRRSASQARLRKGGATFSNTDRVSVVVSCPTSAIHVLVVARGGSTGAAMAITAAAATPAAGAGAGAGAPPLGFGGWRTAARPSASSNLLKPPALPNSLMHCTR